jgi:protein TonB
MALCCLLYTADDTIVAPIRQVLAELGIEAEHCSEASSAVEKVSGPVFQIVIIDWERQPEAGALLNAARVRKPNERPLMLAVVSDDASVPKALQAGANSILRKPLLVNQVTDTLTTARDLLRAKENASNAAQASAVPSATAHVASSGAENDKILRAGDLLESPSSTPGSAFVPDSTATIPLEFTNEQVRPLKDLEPVAAAVQESAPAPPAPQPDEGPRGLEWYLKNRGVQRATAGQAAAAAAAPAPAPDAGGEKTDLLTFDQTPSFAGRRSEPLPEAEQKVQDQKEERRLFAYIDGEEEQPERKKSRSGFALGKKAIIAAAVIAACAVAAAPQAPWHPQMKGLWKRGQQTVRAWLNPQLVTTAQAPPSHENFGRAGDEYKLPAVESIPDATTDPSQIRVVPVVDPTLKKPNGATDQTPTTSDGSDATTPDQGVQVQENQTPQPGADPFKPDSPAATAPQMPRPTQGEAPASEPQSTEPPRPTPQVPASLLAPPVSQPKVTTNPAAEPAGSVPTPGNVPSSLKSHMASMTPEASGNKPVENALPAIEPVALSEAAARALISDQPAVQYPASAKGQQGTVVLQLLIGRDGSVQDAKFQQGSLAFARAAIDGVKQWKFKPYMFNGRPVSVQTTMSVSFKPGV